MKSWKWIGEVFGVVILLDISKFPSTKIVRFFTLIRAVKERVFSSRPHQHSVSSSVWMFANQISKKWHLGVVLFDISLMVAEGRNIFSEHTKDWVYFLSCELTIQLSICLFYCIFHRFILYVLVTATAVLFSNLLISAFIIVLLFFIS